jgi:hypothetical protein
MAECLLHGHPNRRECNRGIVFSAPSVTRYYKQKNWSSELVARQSPAGKYMSTESENIVEIYHQATTSEYITDLKELVRVVVNCGVREFATVF